MSRQCGGFESRSAIAGAADVEYAEQIHREHEILLVD
jgi:hypothetical protein